MRLQGSDDMVVRLDDSRRENLVRLEGLLRLAQKVFHKVRDQDQDGIAADAGDLGMERDLDFAQCRRLLFGDLLLGPVLQFFEFRDLSADPTYEEAAEISAYIGEGYNHGYENGQIDEVTLVFNHAKNGAEQTLIVQQVLPINMMSFADVLGLEPKEEDVLEPYRDGEKKIPGDVDFEPDAATVMHQLMVAYLRNTFYYALIDSAAAEQGARRTAMKSATDNATEMAETLTRLYNRVRQGAITTEISEIVGGAAALED